MTDVLLTLTKAGAAFLGQQLLYSTLIFGLIWLLTRLLKQKTPFLHFALWSLVLVRLVMPPDMAAPWSLRSLLEHPLPKSVSGEMVITGSFDDSPPAFSINSHDLIENGTQVPASLVLFVLWLTGVIIFSIIMLSKRRQYRQTIKASLPISDPETLTQLEYWKKRFGIKRSIRLLVNDDINTPFTMGLYRPVICMPLHLQNDTDNITPIIAHECAHIKRLDDLQIRLQGLVHAFYFFNPIIWITNQNLNQCREILCDQMVLRDPCMKRKAYAKSLLYMLQQNKATGYTLALLPEFGRNSQFIINRIHQISKGKLMKTNNILFTLGVLLLGLLILPMAAYTPKTFAKAPRSVVEVSQPNNMDMNLLCPLKSGKITMGYGDIIDPFTKKQRFHKGVDIRAAKGANIYAAADGKVIKAISEYQINKGRGRYMVIQHENGFFTLYSHMNELAVSEGQTVKAGTVIGYVGTTGRSTGSHLHFEVLQGEENLDPATIVDFSSLRADVN